MSKICSNCHHTMPESAPFCGNCGAAVLVQAVTSQSRFCAKCGSVLPPQARFCKSCGVAVELIVKRTAPSQTPPPMPQPQAVLVQNAAPKAPPAVLPIKTNAVAEKKPKKLGFKAIAIMLAALIVVTTFFVTPAFGLLQMKARASATEKVFQQGAELKETVYAKKGAIFGDSGKTAWTVELGKNTFTSDAVLSMKTLSYNQTAAYTPREGEIVGGILEIAATSGGQDEVYLNTPATVSMVIPSSEKFDKANMDRYVAACLYQGEWIMINPEVTDLSKGIVTFETDHFTSYAVLHLDEQAFIQKLASDYAKREWAKGNAKEQVMLRLKVSIEDALTNAGIKDKAQQDRIILNIKKSTKFDSLVTDIENGKNVDVSKVCSEMSADAIMSQYVDFPGGTMIPGVGTVSSLAKGTAELERGNYKNATVHFAKAIAQAFPPTKILNAAVDGIQLSGILWRDWDRFSQNIAFKVFSEYIGDKGNSYSITSPEWRRVMSEMYGSPENLENAALAEYSIKTGKSIEKIKKDETAVQTAIEEFNNALKDRFTERYNLERELTNAQAENIKIVNGMMKAGLFEHGALAYESEMDVRDRIDQLFVMRAYILDLFNGEMPILSIGESHEGNLNDAISYLLICRGDNAQFFEWLEEKGYIGTKKPAQSSSTPESESGKSFRAEFLSVQTGSAANWLEIGIKMTLKQTGNFSFDVGSNGGVAVSIPASYFEFQPDYSGYFVKYNFNGISLASSKKQDSEGFWELDPGAFTANVTLVDPNTQEGRTLDYNVTYTGSIREYGEDNVQILLRINYQTTDNGALSAEKQTNTITVILGK